MPNGDVDVFFDDVGKAFAFNPAALRLYVPTVEEISRSSIQSTLESATPGKAVLSSS